MAALNHVKNALLSLNPPSCYSVGTLDLPDLIGLGWINGIGNDLETALGHGNYISNLLGGYRMQGVHNPTWGIDIDVFLASKASLEYTVTPAAEELIANWIKHYIQTEGRGVYVQYCHSFGTTVTRNALRAAPEYIRKMVKVVALAPHCFIAAELCSEVVHLVSHRDPVRHVDILGRKKAEVEGTIAYLSPVSNGLFDHGAQSETLRGAIPLYGRRFMRLADGY